MADAVVEWLLGVDPAVGWQVRRDLLDAPEAEWRAEQARVETEGWGARLLGRQDPDGQWAGGAFVPAGFDWSTMATVGQPFTATCFTLDLLREMGLPPTSAAAVRTARLVGEASRWDHDGQPFWDGEVEECINGRLVATGAWFGVDVAPVVERLLGQRQPDGGWNCEREQGSVRSSFDSTINVVEGLLAFEVATGGSDAVREARHGGEAFLLERHLFRRLSTGEVADPDHLRLVHPHRWHHDVLRGLDHLRAASQHDGTAPDGRLGEAIDVVRAKRRPDGTWAADRHLPGAAWFAMDDGPGSPDPWLTLRARRVLRWWDAAG